MKVAVYAIGLNEAAHVERWAASAADADLILLADTGSTDDTVALAEQAGVHVVNIRVVPWRFDDARNAALAALPADIDLCVTLDLDEVLEPGWRAALEACPDWATRVGYHYTWSPEIRFTGDRIHRRAGFRWRHPVHEVITAYGAPDVTWTSAARITHLPDPTKPRSQYLPLLQMAAAEAPTDDRTAHYLAREYYFHGRTDEAVAEFRRHLSLPTAVWAPERAASLRYLAKMLPDERPALLTAAIRECPGRREPLVELAACEFDAANWPAVVALCEAALSITERPMDYLCEEFAWGPIPTEFLDIARQHLGENDHHARN